MPKDRILVDGAKSPLISVVMSVYNAGSYVGQAIDSILGQSLQDFEFIIINDGSTDDTLEIIKSYSDARIMLISRENKGLVYSLNEGIDLARGRFIARMDGDDIAMSDRFKKQINFLEKNKKCDVVDGQIQLIDSKGQKISGSFVKPLMPNQVKLLLGYGSIIAHPTIMLRSSILKQTGKYRQEWWPAEDFDLFQRIAEVGSIYNLADVVLKYRIVDEGITSQNSKNQQKKSEELAFVWRHRFKNKVFALNPMYMYYLILQNNAIVKKYPNLSIKDTLDQLQGLYVQDAYDSKGILGHAVALLARFSRKVIVRHGH